MLQQEAVRAAKPDGFGGTTQRSSVEGRMIERFEGDLGRQVLLTAIQDQRLVAGNADLAQQLVDAGTLIEVPQGQVFIEQGGASTDVFFIVAGSAAVLVNGKVVANRFSGDHVGEMSAIEPSRPRAATLVASQKSVLLQVPAQAFIRVADASPAVWRTISSTLARRLEERNHLVTQQRQRVKVFIMSSVEAIPITDLIIRHFAHDRFLAISWQHGVFKASHYALEDLETQLDDVDFAIAVAYSDDITTIRGQQWPTVRDNVVFELGLFVGRLGRRRAFLMEPRDNAAKLPSDLAGLTTIPFRFEPGKDAMASIAPACAELRERILHEGAKE